MTRLILATMFSLFQATGNPAQSIQPSQQQPRKASIESTSTSLPAQVATRASALEQHARYTAAVLQRKMIPSFCG